MQPSRLQAAPMILFHYSSTENWTLFFNESLDITNYRNSTHHHYIFCWRKETSSLKSIMRADHNHARRTKMLKDLIK
jgi:hypothetical protein